ncbi:MAG: penicillin-binding protein 2 [Lachnospiraceae bacterium]|nr:penicillin-binding protein 2 [Lachnospiraceae bacterium]
MKTSQNGNRNKRRVLTGYMQEKLAVTVLVITLALIGLVAVLYNLIEEKSEDYTQIVLNQHSSFDSRTIPYRRGDIVDRNGTYLATSEKVYNLIIDANQINKAADDFLEPTVSALCEVFGYERQEILDVIQNNPDSYYIRYERQLSAEQKEAFETMQVEFNTKSINERKDARIKGVWFEDEYRRLYPYDSLACNVVGFSFDNGQQGSGGIEQYYNSELIGTNGREYGYLDSESNMETVIKSAENGNTIVSTIDVNIQKIVEKYIDEWMNGIGSETAAVLVMDPNSGEILAMSSNRRFDLNNPRDLSTMYTEEQIAAMTEAEKNDAWNKMWRNFVVSDSYEPGSPAKPLTVAACLEEGVIGKYETFVCDGGQHIGGYNIRCVSRIGHGTLDATWSIMESCNDAMMQMAARLGTEKFAEYQELFGFGQKTGIDLPGEADTSGLIFKADNMGPTDLACNSFGQTYNCTMVQMAAALSSIINGGSYYEPHVVKQILNEQGAVVKKVEPNLVRETVSQSTSEFLIEAMFQTVDHEEGTGKAGRVAGYTVGGKTGTAQKLPRSANNYLVSFAGFAPADDPQVLVYVVIDTPHLPGEEQAHSTFATEIFQKILTDILPYMNVFPDTEVVEEVDESLANQEEGITNQNQGGLEPTEGSENPEGGEATEPETDADGNPIEVPTENYDEEVIPYEGGLGLPDSHAGGSSVIDPIPEGVTSVDTPAPGEAAPGESAAQAKETKPDDGQ